MQLNCLSLALLHEVASAVKTGRRKRFSLPGRTSALYPFSLSCLKNEEK